jgi:hypothetical protein
MSKQRMNFTVHHIVKATTRTAISRHKDGSPFYRVTYCIFTDVAGNEIEVRAFHEDLEEGCEMVDLGTEDELQEDV